MHAPKLDLKDLQDLQVGCSTVTSGGPVTDTVTEPIPPDRSREGLFSVCLASGNQRICDFVFDFVFI